MSRKSHIRRDDTVVVLTGEDKGKEGRVLSVDRRARKVAVEGVNVRKKTLRRTYENPSGGITERTMPIDISNVMEKGRYEQRQGKRQNAAQEANENSE